MKTDRMKPLIVGLYAVPSLLVIGASVALMEQSTVVLSGVLSCALTVVMTCSLLGFARNKGRRLWPILAGAITCLLLVASVVTIHWPLSIRYLLSRTSLDRVAQNVRAGQPL